MTYVEKRVWHEDADDSRSAKRRGEEHKDGVGCTAQFGRGHHEPFVGSGCAVFCSWLTSGQARKAEERR